MQNFSNTQVPLEDRLRTMIVSHQQPHEAQHLRHLGADAQITSGSNIPPNPSTHYGQNTYPVNPTPFPSAQQRPLATNHLSQPNHSSSAQFNPHQKGFYVNSQKSGAQYNYGQRPHTYRQYHRSSLPSIQPPPPNLDHFPALGSDVLNQKMHYIDGDQTHPRNGDLEYPDTRPGNQGPKIYNWRPPHTHSGPPQARYAQFYAAQAQSLDKFAEGLLDKITPPASEISTKLQLLKKLNVICQTLSPTAELITFGSFVTGFGTVASDIDCVFSPGKDVEDQSINFPFLLEKKLQDEGFNANLLTRTRVPIIKMAQKATLECPQELQCDIGFKNHLGIHNSQLLLSYSMCDERLRKIILVVKWWAQRRHINSPYRGTLSSYGYVLMILHYLINIVEPPVLPNLQLYPIPENTPDNEIYYRDGNQLFSMWYFKEVETIPPSKNTSSVGELLRGFFEYYAYKFVWGLAVVSIRTKGGLLTKDEKGWVAATTRPGITSAPEGSGTWEVKDRYLFALEDPLEITHNVARTCTGSGVGRIRDELRRAMTLIKTRDGGKKLAELLCEEAPPERPFVKWDGDQNNAEKTRKRVG